MNPLWKQQLSCISVDQFLFACTEHRFEFDFDAWKH